MAIIERVRPRAVPPSVVDRGPNDDGRDGSGGGRPVPNGQLGLWVFMIAVTMLFSGLISAYIVTRSGQYWQAIPMPEVLWLNTGLLILSSGALEMGRRALKSVAMRALKNWLWVATLLGVSFLIGQLEAWRQLRQAGVYLPTNQHSSFFYLMTGMHGLHLLGGLAVLAYVLALAWPGLNTRTLQTRFGLCAVYWHYLGGLWLYLFGLFLLKP